MGHPVVLLMVGDFQDRRVAVKGEYRKLCREGVMMCVDHVLRVLDTWVNVGRSVSKTEEQVSRLFEKVAETRDFYSADLSVVADLQLNLSSARARRTTEDHGERRAGVKVDLFSAGLTEERRTFRLSIGQVFCSREPGLLYAFFR